MPPTISGDYKAEKRQKGWPDTCFFSAHTSSSLFSFFLQKKGNKFPFDHAKKNSLWSNSLSVAHFFSSSLPTQQSESWGGHRCTLSSTSSLPPPPPSLCFPFFVSFFHKTPRSVHPPPLTPCYGWSHLPSTLWTSRSVESRPWSCTYMQGTLPSTHWVATDTLTHWHNDTLTHLHAKT